MFLVIKILNDVNLKKSTLIETMSVAVHSTLLWLPKISKKKNGTWWKQSFKPSKNITEEVLTCLKIFPSSEEFNRVPITVISIISSSIFGWLMSAL